MEERINPYEGMFLVSPTEGADAASITEHITGILERVDAKIIALRKWDERRLSFEIAKNKRGVYFLYYFTCPAGGITEIDRLCNLSERILRFMVTRSDHLSTEEMQAADAREDLNAAPGAQQPAEESAPANA